MCGRYALFSKEEMIEMWKIINELNRKYAAKNIPMQVKTSGEIFPGDCAPVISANGPVGMIWGFPLQGKRIYPNVRSETADQKFQQAYRTRRIVVPSTGFYEWTHPENQRNKEKYRFNLPGDSMFYMAGIYTEYAMENSMQKQPKYTILTTGANDSMRPYHNRMPVQLSKLEIDNWLKHLDFADEVIQRPQPHLTALQMETLTKPRQISLFE